MAGEKPTRSSYRPRLWILTGVTAVVVLALGLGLGLGLGLKHHHHDASTSPSNETLPYLTPQTSDNFVVGTIVGQSPQDRKYNLTLALANGAPDGVNKTMLVINGTSITLLPWLQQSQQTGCHPDALHQQTQASSPFRASRPLLTRLPPLWGRIELLHGVSSGIFCLLSCHFWI
jgi:hypothetical protein